MTGGVGWDEARRMKVGNDDGEHKRDVSRSRSRKRRSGRRAENHVSGEGDENLNVQMRESGLYQQRAY